MQKVYVLIANNGDGSTSAEYFIDKELVDKLVYSDSEYMETYNMNESVEVLEFPDGFDLTSCGIRISTADDFN